MTGNMRDARFWRILSRAVRSSGALFLAAFLIRVGVSWQLISTNQDRFYKASEEQARIAWAVASGHGFSSPWPNTPLEPTAQQPPIYPYLLAGIFRLTGAYTRASLTIALCLNAIFASLTAVLIYRIGKSYFSDFAGLLSAWVWACWIYEVVLSAKLWESSLSALCLTAGIWLLPTLVETQRLLPWIGFGLLAGVVALTNPSLMPAFVGFWIWLYWTRDQRSIEVVLRGLLSVAAFIVVLIPWTVRNYVVFHRLMPVRDNFGLELWIGNHEGVTHLYDFRGGFPLIDPGEYNRLGELPFMEAKREVALQFIRQHPWDFLRLCGQRIVDFWSTPQSSLWVPLSVAAWIGLLLLLWRKRSAGVPFAIAMIFFPVVYYVTHTWSTYRHPIEPVAILLAVYAIDRLAERLGLKVREVIG
jgi:hypothetical protein